MADWTYLVHGVLKHRPLLKDVSEEQVGQDGEAVEGGGLGEGEEEAGPAQLGKQEGHLVIPREAQTDPQDGVHRVGVHRDADQTGASPAIEMIFITILTMALTLKMTMFLSLSLAFTLIFILLFTMPGVPKKAEWQIFSTLQAKNFIFFYIIR